jgi:hypothetical protein
MDTLEGSDKKWVAKYPPNIAPSTTTKFHLWDFQSQLKKGTFFPNPAIEHKLLRFVDIPKDLPKYSKHSITDPIKKPETDQCQVEVSKFILNNLFLQK